MGKSGKNMPMVGRMAAEILFSTSWNGSFDLFFLMESGFQCDNPHNKERLATRGSA